MKNLIWLLIIMTTSLTACDKKNDISKFSSTTGFFSLGKSGVHSGGNPQVFILAGQSNMPGADPSGVLSTNPRIQMYGLDDKLEIASDPLWNGVGLVEKDIYNPAEIYGVGPGHFFAQDLESTWPGVKIVLVPCAKGATGIDEWLPGTPLFNAMVRRTQNAIKTSSGTLAGLLFWQGEYDYIDMAHAISWASKFTQMVTSLRAQVGQIPVVYVQIAPVGGTPAGYQAIRDTLRANQATVNLINCTMISADGSDLLAYTNGEHFYTPGYAIMGQRFLNAYLNEVE